jgi:hypothetical protein
MKILHLAFIAFLIPLAACSTAQVKPDESKDSPETVLITYHVKPGKEAEMAAVLRRAWEIYLREHLVFSDPHIIVRDAEKDGKPRMVEIFTWVSHSAPDHAPKSVKDTWNEMMSLCEPRDGHGGLEGGEVELLAPKGR